MSASTLPKLGPEMTLALEITEVGEKDPQRAASIATRAAHRYPNFKLPAGGDREVTFAQLRDHFAEQAKANAPVAAPEESVPPAAPESAAPRKAAPRKAAPRKATSSAPRKAAPAKKAAPVKAVPAPVDAAPTVLRLVHDGAQQTAIFGVEKGSPAHLAIGSAKKGGLGWWFFPDNESFYIPGSQGYAPDYIKINQAIGRLEALTGDDGAPLYRVESAIVTEVDGKALPVRKTREEMREWQKAYTAAKNLFSWEISMGTAECGTCGAQGLGEKSARLGKTVNGMPVVECATCGGFAAEQTVRIPVTLALPAAPAAVFQAPVPVEQQEKAECPLCHTMQLVKGGKLALHTFNGGACRGKLGQAVVDVEPEEAPAPRRTRSTARKATEPVVVEDAQGLVVKIQIQRTLSRSKQGDVATDMRKAIERMVTSRGMRIELRRDKGTGVATITVLESAGRDASDVEKGIIAAVTSVPGFGNRINR